MHPDIASASVHIIMCILIAFLVSALAAHLTSVIQHVGLQVITHLTAMDARPLRGLHMSRLNYKIQVQVQQPGLMRYSMLSSAQLAV